MKHVPLVEARGGMMAASTTGFASSQDLRVFVGAASVGVLGRIPLGRALRLEVLPDVRLPLSRDAFHVREGGVLVEVHRPAPVDSRLSLGLGWEVP